MRKSTGGLIYIIQEMLKRTKTIENIQELKEEGIDTQLIPWVDEKEN